MVLLLSVVDVLHALFFPKIINWYFTV